MTKSGALRGNPYLCGSTPSKPGVAGRLPVDSCTVSSLGATPLGPRDDAFMLKLVVGSSCSPRVTASSLAGMRWAGAGEGEECWTTMEGIDGASSFLAGERRELRREREWARAWASGGGGDLRRGE